ncbi:MAG: pyridoxamine 5'-phosphate oxidase family protein [Pseudomonadota bacterium]
MSEPFDDLEATLEQVWQRLGRGVADPKAAARHPVLATVGAAGAEARVVVLRAVDRAAGQLTVYTDAQSSKVTELQAEPRASLLVWDQKARFQIRLRVRFEIGTAPEIWERLSDGARSLYGGAPPPGAEIAWPSDHVPGAEAQRFAVLTGEILEIETLHLGRDSHRRALFREGRSAWLVP